MTAPTGQRMRKTLACTAAANAYQKQFGIDLKRRVVDEGEPFAIVQADTPHEIFHVMDIPIITNQWWSAYISAKQLSNHYFEVMAQAGYPKNSCKYCSLGLACTLANDPKILLLDEPANHLDIQHQLTILNVVQALPVTTLIALHDLNQALKCDRLAVLERGRLVALGEPLAVLTPQRLQETFGVRAHYLTDPFDGAQILRFHS